MESYGVACAAERRMASFTVIKGISDFADPTKNDEYRQFASLNSALQLRFMIEEKASTPESDGLTYWRARDRELARAGWI